MLAVSILAACGDGKEELAQLRLNEVREKLRAVGLSVAVVKDNKQVYIGTSGIKNLDDSTALSTDDIFRIASISKSFTATAIMQLHEAGKFGLDDEVSPALGIELKNPKFPETPITYRMLLSHTSSLNDTMGYFTFDVVNPAVNAEAWRAYNSYAPGTQYEYCNLGYNLLGALVEIHSGERFDRYIRKHILDPLGIQNAGFNVDSLNAALFVPIYSFTNRTFKNSPDAYLSRAAEIENGYVLGRSTPLFSPTGGMKIAPKDLAKHMLVQMNGGSLNGVQILSKESVEQMQTPYTYEGKSFNYGFAIETTDQLVDGVTLKGHTGSAYGLYSAMFFDPQKKFGIIVMTNGYAQVDLSVKKEVVNVLYDLFIRDKK